MSIKILGLCGLISACLVALSPLSSHFLPASGAIMVFANVYCLMWGKAER